MTRIWEALDAHADHAVLRVSEIEPESLVLEADSRALGQAVVIVSREGVQRLYDACGKWLNGLEGGEEHGKAPEVPVPDEAREHPEHAWSTPGARLDRGLADRLAEVSRSFAAMSTDLHNLREHLAATEVIARRVPDLEHNASGCPVCLERARSAAAVPLCLAVGVHGACENPYGHTGWHRTLPEGQVIGYRWKSTEE